MTSSAAHAEQAQGTSEGWHDGAPADRQRPHPDHKGAFEKGNAAGPGNPFNGRIAALRHQLRNALTPERMGRAREALLANESGIALGCTEPLVTEFNGEEAPTANGANGRAERMAR